MDGCERSRFLCVVSHATLAVGGGRESEEPFIRSPFGSRVIKVASGFSSLGREKSREPDPLPHLQ